MNTSKEEGTPLTIDAYGNIIRKPNGASRWAAPRFYKCHHEACGYPSTIVSSEGKAHNCCTRHNHEKEVVE